MSTRPHKTTVHISPERLDEFIELYRKEYGVTPSREEALKVAEFVVRMVKAVYYPAPENNESK